MPEQKITYRNDDFPLLGGGLNDLQEPFNIQDNQAQECLNVISEDGKTIETRKGFIPYNPSAITATPAIYGMKRSYLDSGAHFVVKAGTKLYKGFQAALTTELKTGLVAGSLLASDTQGDFTYFTSKDDTPFIRKGGASSTFQNGITKPSAAPTFTLGTGRFNAKKGHKIGYTYYDHITGTESNLSELSVSSGIFDSKNITVTVVASSVSRVTKIKVYLTKDEGETGEISYFAQEIPDASASVELDLTGELFSIPGGEDELFVNYTGIGGLEEEAPYDHDLPPKGSLFIIRNNQAFSAGDPDHPNRISRTPVNELEHWPDNLDYRQDIQGVVTKLFELKGLLFATTANEFLIWDGKGWTVRLSSVGCQVGGSLANSQIMSDAGIPVDVVIFYTLDRIYAFDTQNVQLLSQRPDGSGITPTIKSFHQGYINNLASFYNNWKYYLSYTSSTGTYNDRTMILDTERMTWWPQEYGFNVASVWNESPDSNEIMIGNSAGDGFVYWLEQGYSDNGTAIEVTYKTKDFNFGLKDYDKVIRRLETEYDFKGGTLRLRHSIDGSTLITWETVSISATGKSKWGVGKWGVGKWAVIQILPEDFSFPMGTVGRRCYIEFYKNDDNQRLHIKRLTMQVIPIPEQLR